MIMIGVGVYEYVSIRALHTADETCAVDFHPNTSTHSCLNRNTLTLNIMIWFLNIENRLQHNPVNIHTHTHIQAQPCRAVSISIDTFVNIVFMLSDEMLVFTVVEIVIVLKSA